MARRLIRRRALARVALAVTTLALGGCASTETLYAEYDAGQCLVVEAESAAAPIAAAALPEPPEPPESAPMTLRELISNSYFPWEPAVYFGFDEHELDETNAALLDGAVEVLTRYPGLLLSLQGFTDRLGPDEYNHRLAGRRVGSVREHIAARGIEHARIVSQPIGEGLPEFGDDKARARAINRRVELMLLDEEGRPLHPLFDFSALEPSPPR